MTTYLPPTIDSTISATGAYGAYILSMPVLPNIFEVTRTYLMDVDLRKAPFVSCYYPLSVFLE